jgi:hypothetical protein
MVARGGIEPPTREKSAEQTRLRIPDPGQPVVVVCSESGLTVAHEIDGSHDQHASSSACAISALTRAGCS